MKKFQKILLITALVAVVALSVFMISACNDNKDDIKKIESIEATVASGTTFTVGQVFDASKITVTAKLDDGTKSIVKKTDAVSFDNRIATLKLDSEGKFTEAGDYTLTVRFSDWETTVTIKVAEAE